MEVQGLFPFTQNQKLQAYSPFTHKLEGQFSQYGSQDLQIISTHSLAS